MGFGWQTRKMMFSARYLYDSGIKSPEIFNFHGYESKLFYGLGFIIDALRYYWRQKSVGFQFEAKYWKRLIVSQDWIHFKHRMGLFWTNSKREGLILNSFTCIVFLNEVLFWKDYSPNQNNVKSKNHVIYP